MYTPVHSIKMYRAYKTIEDNMLPTKAFHCTQATVYLEFFFDGSPDEIRDQEEALLNLLAIGLSQRYMWVVKASERHFQDMGVAMNWVLVDIGNIGCMRHRLPPVTPSIFGAQGRGSSTVQCRHKMITLSNWQPWHATWQAKWHATYHATWLISDCWS